MAEGGHDANDRWAAVQKHGLLDSGAAKQFEAVLAIASSLCDTPMATLSFNDRSRERFVACHGCSFDKLPSAKSFSDHIVNDHAFVLVDDIRTDTRFRNAPLLKDRPDIRFYAGVPVTAPGGEVLGTLAVMDSAGRHLPEEKVAALERLGAHVVPLVHDNGGQDCGAGAAESYPGFDSIFRSLPGAHWLLEPKTLKVVGISDAALGLVFKTRDQVLGKPLPEALIAGRSDAGIAESAKKLAAAARRVVHDGEQAALVAHAYPIEVAANHSGLPQFDRRYWNVTNAPVRSVTGQLLYVLSHAVDVTELVKLREQEGKAAEDRRLLEGQAAKMEQDILKRSKEVERLNDHLHMAQAVANLGSWELSLKGEQNFWSDEVYQILGVDAVDYSGTDLLLDYVHPDDRQELMKRRKLAQKSSDEVEVKHRIVRPDGTIRFVREQIGVVREGKRRLSMLYGTVQDITNQKHVEDELQTRARQQEVVARFGQKALKGGELEKLIDEAAELVAETLDVEYCKVLKLLPNGTAMKLVAGVGWKDGLIGNAIVNIGRSSQAGYTLLQKHSVIVKDLRKDRRFNGPALLRDHGVISGISVIIAGRDRPWGTLGAHTTRSRVFTQDDVNFFESIANIIAEAAFIRTVTEQMDEREACTNAVLRLTEAAWEGNSYRQLQELAVQEVAATLDVEYVKLVECLNDGTGMKVVAGTGWQKGVVGHAILAAGHGSQGGFVLNAPDAVLLADLPNDSRFRPSPMLLEHGVDSGISHAIRCKGTPIGMIGAHTSKRRYFTDIERNFISKVAALLARAHTLRKPSRAKKEVASPKAPA